ncbi:hypothetical protein Gasu2_69100 [Galdieria sulphuraria]|uniref:Uncharacterized protein n=1 Tax=Galdieria sulphuraria TaxID=130081 RepID=M2Y177_GALSU|nr:uncharacterized protein Gasu_30080 [Galdieria sulphuraria]EME29569.1 hypothetical protein Gasu_30080 [Galdieria sulphuraria]GJD12841.1 hypothetical protein Gasu2_69100 [Galdieria sulphuraria]|eukprot:XP_005706089.1 hypothetical protein Gasu_30080 [Galdieria sulphuraria]
MVVSEIVAATFIYVCGLRRAYRIILRGEKKIRNYLPMQTKSGAYYSLQRRFLRRVFKAIQSAIQYTQNWKRNKSVTSDHTGLSKEKELAKQQGKHISSLSGRNRTSRAKKKDEDVQQGLQLGTFEESKCENAYVRLQVKGGRDKSKTGSETDEPESRAL